MVRDLREYLTNLENNCPEEVLRIEKEVDPNAFEVTTLLTHLEKKGKYPLTYFSNCKNLFGKVSDFPMVTNMYASRKRCAVALGLAPEQDKLPLSLEYARRETEQINPEIISREQAPVKQVVKIGDDADLRQFPVVRHHYMDGGPYIDMSSAMQDPDTGTYNTAFLRTMYKGPRKLGLYMSPRHNWQIVRKNEEVGKPTPIAIVVSHHPGYYLGVLNVCPFGVDDYGVIGSIMDAPLRLVASETWGDSFMVPADAEILIEGEVLPNVREIEGPFGEFPGYFGPQRMRWVVEVKAITHRQNAIYQDVFIGHRDVWQLGSLGKEGSIYNRIKGVVPTVKAVHLPNSGAGRYNCYVSIDKKVNGESKQAALIAIGACDFVKHVTVVDSDVDPFNEEEVQWAVATRVQADQDIDIIKNVKHNTLDPSMTDEIMGTKMIIDATKPLGRPFAERVSVPDEALDRVKLEDFVSPEELTRIV